MHTYMHAHAQESPASGLSRGLARRCLQAAAALDAPLVAEWLNEVASSDTADEEAAEEEEEQEEEGSEERGSGVSWHGLGVPPHRRSLI